MIDPMATGTVKRPSPPETAEPPNTETWAWSKAETERRRHAAAAQPTLAPIDAFPDEYSAADDLAAIRPDADSNATGPHSQTIRGLLGGACAGWRVRPTSVELYDALRADNPTRRQRSIATVLINEASFEELVNAHTEGAFTWRQLARAARRQGAVPPLRIRLINAFATASSASGEPMENLTLPEPAAGLWAAKRSIVRAIPPEMFGQRIPPHLGGGTILAARWKHRISTDIDVLLPGRNTLIDLLQDNDRNIVNQLGGTPEAVAAGRVKIAFDHGFLDISTFRPDPPYGHTVATVDGQLEKVLSSHQILCGKLERVDQMLVRDVFDVLTAADQQPAALAAAASMVSRQRAEAIESAWRNAAGMLADNFHDSIRSSRRAAGAGLGPEAAAAFQAHRYTRLEIDLHSGTLSIRKTIGAGSLEPETYAATSAGRALVQSGVATHLNNNGPVTAPQVLAAIRAAVNAGGERTILDSASRSSIDMINRLDQLDPRWPRRTVPGQAQARTRNTDHGYDR